MTKYLFLFLFLSVIQLNGQIQKVDHLYIKSPIAKELFEFFKNEMKLPVAWDYQNWGSFISGGVSLGNANLEFLYSEPSTDSQFSGIALEPTISSLDLCPILNDRQIKNNGIANYYAPNKSKKTKNILWSTIDLIGLLPPSIHFFICDYKDKEKIQLGRKRQKQLLAKKQRNRLGINRVKEIIIGTLEPNNLKIQLKRLPDLIEKEDGTLGFQQGANFRIVKSEKRGIQAITLQVTSIEKTKQFLESKNCLDTSRRDGTVFLNPKLVDHLRIEFVE